VKIVGLEVFHFNFTVRVHYNNLVGINGMEFGLEAFVGFRSQNVPAVSKGLGLGE
jgi:hypothetical protein